LSDDVREKTMWRSMTGGTRARLAVLSLAGAVALATSGCSLLSGGSGGADPASAGRPSIQIGPDKHVKGAIASTTVPYQGYKIQADIVSLTRYDKVTRLVFVVTPISSGSTDPLPKDTFGETDYTGDVAEVSLIDTKGLQEYDPQTRGSGDDAVCACSYPDDFPLDQPTTLYADYPALPESVDHVTVLLSAAGPVPNVKVSS
jgi:hypothetical protein